MQYDHVLIDAKNTLYRAMYAGLADKNFINSKYDFSVIFFRFVHNYVHRFKPRNLHFFWDSPKEIVWRRSLLPEYKNNRSSDASIDEIIHRAIPICKELITYTNGRNYELTTQEADDLIYAFCLINNYKHCLIISNDSDFRQIAYRFRNVDLYAPLQNKVYDPMSDDIDIVDIKSLAGERSDNISGYNGIGPIRARQLILNPKLRQLFFKKFGNEIYNRNRQIIDLSLNPNILMNTNYIYEQLTTDIKFNYKSIIEVIQKYKVRGLSGEINKTISAFKLING